MEGTNLSPAVQEAKSIVYGNLSQYRVPYSRELEGKNFEIIFEDKSSMILGFPMRDKVSMRYEGMNVLEDGYCMKAQEGAYFIMMEVKGSEPRLGYMIVLDTDNRLCTVVFAKQGEVKERPGLVTRTVKFGAIKDGEKALPTKLACWTKDLVGKKIDWRYNPTFSIIHVYLKENYYTVAINAEMKAAMEKARQEAAERGEEQPERPRPAGPYYEENCLYIKLRENLYLFSFVEKNGGGTQGMMIIDTDRVHDVGCFWGASPDGGREAYMFAAYGKWVREAIPEDETVEIIKKQQKKAE